VNTELFSPELEQCVNLIANLVLNDDATPKLFKLCKFPLALKPVVKISLTDWKAREFQLSDWAMPIVVRTPDGKLYIIGIYIKIIISPVLEDPT